MDAVSADAGSVIVTVAVKVQSVPSVTVTVYVPAARLVAVAVVCTGSVFHENKYGRVPPEAVTVALPVDWPKHNTSVWLVIATTNGLAGSVIVALAVAVQPRESVTVTIYVPADRLLMVAVV
jgi:hypothetical protein